MTEIQKLVPSTYKILKEKTINAGIDNTWIDWAIEMIAAGFENKIAMHLKTHGY